MKETAIYLTQPGVSQYRVPIKNLAHTDSEFHVMGDGKIRERSSLVYMVYDDDVKSPLGKIGDLLYVKETWSEADDDVKYLEFIDNYNKQCPDGERKVEFLQMERDTDFTYPVYKADCSGEEIEWYEWKSPVTMPKKYARYWYKITGIRVERVGEIKLTGIHKEGVDAFTGDFEMVGDIFNAYAKLWNAKHPDFPFESNCWCWVYGIEKVER